MGTVRYTTVNGKIIAEKRNGVRSRYISDSLGSTVALLDNTQTKTDTFEYWPYGEVRTRTGTNPTPFQHVGTQGYYRDSSRKTHVGARELNTQQGRWTTQDPISFRGGDYNLYRYVSNNPSTFIDPSGMAPCPKQPPGACHWCWYNKYLQNGWSAQVACTQARSNCGSAIACGDPPNPSDCLWCLALPIGVREACLILCLKKNSRPPRCSGLIPVEDCTSDECEKICKRAQCIQWECDCFGEPVKCWCQCFICA